MKPIHFEESQTEFAKNQPEYNTLPCHIAANDPNGVVTICWKLTLLERIVLLITGKLWHSVLTFNEPLQPILLETTKPLINNQGEW